MCFNIEWCSPDTQTASALSLWLWLTAMSPYINISIFLLETTLSLPTISPHFSTYTVNCHFTLALKEKSNLLFPSHFSFFYWTSYTDLSSLSVFLLKSNTAFHFFTIFPEVVQHWKGERNGEKATWQHRKPNIMGCRFSLSWKNGKMQAKHQVSPPSCGFHSCASILPLQLSFHSLTGHTKYTIHVTHLNIQTGNNPPTWRCGWGILIGLEPFFNYRVWGREASGP